MGDNSFDVVGELDTLSTPNQIVARMRVALAEVGLEYFCLNFFPRPNQNFEEVVLGCHVPQDWLELYLHKCFVLSDPSIRHCRNAVWPFLYRDAPFDHERDQAALEVVTRAADFGLAEGLVIPVPSSNGVIGDVWIGGHNIKIPKPIIPALHTIGIYAFHRIQQMLGREGNFATPLGEREREVLKWVAAGNSAEEIGNILSLSKRTIEWHIREASIRLGARNRVQAVAIAIRDKLI